MQACVRCTSTGRKCDGYDVVKDQPTNSKAVAAPPPTPSKASWTQTQLFQPSSLSAAFPGDDSERRIFQRFHQVTVPALTGCSETEFWENLVLKVGQQEPVVRNAIVALGTLHEEYQLRGGKIDRDHISAPPYSRALTLNHKAIGQLNQRISNQECDPKLAIIASILFTCFEVLSRNNMAAVVAYQSGMRTLLRQMSARNDPSVSPTSSQATFHTLPRNDLDTLLRVFARYDIHACTFSKGRAEAMDIQLPDIPSRFLGLGEVKMHLDNLIISVYQVLKSDISMARYWNMEHVPVDWQVRRDQGVATFEAWQNATDTFFETTTLAISPEEIKALLGIRLQIRVAIIQLRTCIDSAPETSYDAFEQEFEYIVTQAETLTDAVSTPEAKPSITGIPGFSMELGICHPLFFVATKCRNWLTRRRAITSLRKAGRESVWEGPIMALVAERLVALEEQDVEIEGFIPERNRLHEIRKVVDYDSCQVLIEATKALNDRFDQWETVREIIAF
ncbi:MAG: hypothetical protein Q9227_002799 [Pyrenula ochraceoflavens]